MQSNVPCHIEFNSENIDKTDSFYKELFGWDVVDKSIKDYYLLRFSADSPIGGAIRIVKNNGEKSNGRGTGSPLVYVRVKDIDQCIKDVKRLGATINTEKITIPGRGCFAHFIDFDNNCLGLWQEC